MLKKEFQYYLDHQEELVEQYNGKIIVIIEKSIVGVYKDKIHAYLDTIKKHKPGTFLIIECSPGTDSYTYHQRSRIITPV